MLVLLGKTIPHAADGFNIFSGRAQLFAKSDDPYIDRDLLVPPQALEAASEAAREAATVEPLRESSYRLLMTAHAEAGNAAEALRVYEQCRNAIAEALGVAPSSDTKELKRQILETL